MSMKRSHIYPRLSNKRLKIVNSSDLKFKKLIQRANNYFFQHSWMVAASRTRNFMLKDPLLDYLKMRLRGQITNVKLSVTANNRKNNPVNKSVLLKTGDLFEQNIVDKIKSICESRGLSFIQIAYSPQDSADVKKFSKTLEIMRQGFDVLYQPVLQDHKNGLFGVPDLLIRSDKINRIIGNEVEVEFNKSELFPYSYQVVDIKWSGVKLTANKKNILNTGSVPAFKGQIAVYNKILSSIYDKPIRFAYVLGRCYYRKNLSYPRPLDYLGCIDFKNFDNRYIGLSQKAAEWVRKLRNNWKSYELFPPSVPELYPNMKNKLDAPFRREKEMIAKKLNEITMLWHCGVYKRNIAFDQGVYEWKDCDSDILQITKKKRENVDNIIQANLSNKILPEVVSGFHNNWQTKDSLEFYLDFETIPRHVFESLKLNGYQKFDKDLTFNIGLGYTINQKYYFKSFHIKEISLVAERQMFIDFLSFVDRLVGLVDASIDRESIKIFHWGSFEPRLFDKLCVRHDMVGNIVDELSFIDFCKQLRNMKVGIPGSFSYGLKPVSQALINLGKIDMKWDTECSDGYSAMFGAAKGLITQDEIVLNDIYEYNRLDCLAVYQIVQYFRDNHVDIVNTDVVEKSYTLDERKYRRTIVHPDIRDNLKRIELRIKELQKTQSMLQSMVK